jgi:hypothetical protein
MTASTMRPRVALSRTEVRLMAGTSTLWAGCLITVALCTVWSRGAGFRWTAFGANSGRASLFLAGVLVLVGHLATSRDHRHGAAEFTRTLPTPPRRRMLALLALIPAAGVAGALAEGAELLILLPSRPAGTLQPWLLAVPVLAPMIGAALGVAAGLWWPSTAGGPLTLFAATAVLAMLPVLGSGPGDLPWLLFPVPVDRSTTTAAAAWHVLYLLAVLAVVVGAALVRHWRLWAALIVAIALAAAATAIHRQQAEQPTATAEQAAVGRR